MKRARGEEQSDGAGPSTAPGGAGSGAGDMSRASTGVDGAQGDGARALKVLEFYCGMGGLHYAFDLAAAETTGSGAFRGEVLESFDTNPNTNTMYAHNFGRAPCHKDIGRHCTAAVLDAYGADVWLASPPCQPYTRNGKQLDMSDHRAQSFLQLLDALKHMDAPPTYFLMENVAGFEHSQTHGVLLKTLQALTYTVREFVLSPLQFGEPNQRTRYYLLAKRGEAYAHAAPPSGGVLTSIPGHASCQAADAAHVCRPVREYLEPGIDTAPLAVPEKMLLKRGGCIDMCMPDDTRTCCFTKSYAQYLRGTGSVLQQRGERVHDANKLADGTITGHNTRDLPSLLALGLRFFSPREVANLHSFPAHMVFPSTLTRKQCYKMLGNSLNVRVVAELVKYLLQRGSSGDDDTAPVPKRARPTE